MSRRRRRVKIKSSSRLFAFILFNLLLLASCITAHYQQWPSSTTLDPERGPFRQLALASSLAPSSATTATTTSSATTPTTTAINTNAEQNQNQHYKQQKPSQQHQASLSSSFQQQQQQKPTSQPVQQPSYDDASIETAEQQQLSPNVLNRDNGNGQTATSLPSNNNNLQSIPSISSGLCSMLPQSVARQLKLCRFVAHSSQADEAVALGTTRGLAECRQQFRSERWNCTHSAGDHHLLTSKLAQSVGTREGGFVQAIVAAGIVHSIATACSIGSLNDCACDKTRVGPMRQRDQNWKWGGCSNNIRHGMTYAKHLVELLDAVHEHHHHHQMQRSLNSASNHHHGHHGHQHHHHQQHHHQRQYQTLQQHDQSHRYRQSQTGKHQLEKRSLAQQRTTVVQQQQQQQPAANLFCQKNQSISQTTHIELIKSLLAKNSLERHQDFRLAMNAHNNKVGRMAVAKKMEIKCRCHGLSGSCSLKTCWLKLPDFQQVGVYLKRKYEESIHLPSAINVNKLIPMMDRNEISAILQQQHHQHQAPTPAPPQPPVGLLVGATTLGEQQHTLGTATESSNSLGAAVSNPASQTLPEAAAWSGEAPASQAAIRLNFYQRHKQLERGLVAPNPTATTTMLSAGSKPSSLSPMAAGSKQPTGNGTTNSSAATSLYLHGDEVQVLIAPLSQLQYQTLLRDMKLCHASSNTGNGLTQQPVSNATTTTARNTRELHAGSNQFEALAHYLQAGASNVQHSQHQIGRKSALAGANSNEINAGFNVVGASNSGKLALAASGLATPHNTNHLRLATTGALGQQQQQQQQLGQLLQAPKRDELVYLHKSPDYCEPDPRHGFAGVQSRSCTTDPQAPDSCDRLCCGRGYERREIELRYNCDCKFQYCCKIHCNVCQKTLVEYVCK